MTSPTLAGPPSVAIVIDDLAAALVASRHPAGIQRVVAGLVDTALDQGDATAWPAITSDGSSGHAIELNPVDPASLPWRGGSSGRGARAGLLRTGRRIARALPLPSGVLRRAKVAYGRAALGAGGLRTEDVRATPDLVLVPGAFWSGGSARRVRDYADATGVPVSLLAHDLFPLTHPEWYPDDLRHDFAEALDVLAPVVRRVVTLSRAVADDVAAQQPELARMVRVATPTLAAHGSGTASVGRSLPSPIAEPYVLALGTVEPRKNHLLIARAWDLARRDERLAGARLVIAGRRGWLADQIERELARDATWRGIVRLTDVSDDELEALYAGCSATVHASLAEGFGLPARESIVRGIPTLVSTGIPGDGLPEGAYEAFAPDDAERLAQLMTTVVEGPRVRREFPLGEGSGWEPVLVAMTHG